MNNWAMKPRIQAAHLFRRTARGHLEAGVLLSLVTLPLLLVRIHGLTKGVGNVEVSTVYRETNTTVAVKPTPSKTQSDAWIRWALAAGQHKTPTFVQLVHAGRQSPIGAGSRGRLQKTIAPSAIPLRLGEGLVASALGAIIFGTPKAMTLEDIHEVVAQFTVAAKLAHESGFKGVELHAAHGYLLCDFLSPKANIRTDDYGGTAAKRTKIVVDIIRAIRKEVPSSFCVGIKLNSADIGGHENVEEALEQIAILSNEQIDFIEISGGSFENPRFFEGDKFPSSKTVAREAFFLDFAQMVRARFPNLVLMVTGGFRSRKGMRDAVESNACNLVGLGRPAAVFPNFPKEVILNEELKDADAAVTLYNVKRHWFVDMLSSLIPVVGGGIDSVSCYHDNKFPIRLTTLVIF